MTRSVRRVFTGAEWEARVGYCRAVRHGALRELGAGRASVIRTRMFVTDIARWAEFGRAHAEYFGDTPPATSMVEVRKLIADDMLIEIEVDAVADED